MDHNVTRHIHGELANQDWSTMVLHLLGMDHIGHKMGPQSSYMYPKQKEMDALVQEIFEAQLQFEHLGSSLFVLCGDHGMTEAGNHGGASASETSTAMLLISPKIRRSNPGTSSPLIHDKDFGYHSSIGQSDIIPSLAVLLGFPIPKNSLGLLIPEVLSLNPCNVPCTSHAFDKPY